MARRGRKRNPQAKRNETTREGRSSRDLGTEELRVKKLMAVGAAVYCEIRPDRRTGEFIPGPLRVDGWRPDPAQSIFALTRLAVAGTISDQQCRAGLLFAMMREITFNSLHPRIAQYRSMLVDFERSARGDDAFEIMVERFNREQYELASAALRATGTAAYRVTCWIVIDDIAPAYVTCGFAFPRNDTDREVISLLKQGLDALVGHFATRPSLKNSHTKKNDDAAATKGGPK